MATKRRYGALAVVAKYYTILGGLFLIAGCFPLYAVAYQFYLLADGGGSFEIIGLGVLSLFALIFTAVSCWALAQGIDLAQDCEDHLRHIRDQQRTAPASGQRRRSA